MFTPEPCPTCGLTSPCEHYVPLETWPLKSLTTEDQRIQRQKESNQHDNAYQDER